MRTGGSARGRGLFTTDRLLGTIDDYAALLDEPQTRNFRALADSRSVCVAELVYRARVSRRD